MIVEDRFNWPNQIATTTTTYNSLNVEKSSYTGAPCFALFGFGQPFLVCVIFFLLLLITIAYRDHTVQSQSFFSLILRFYVLVICIFNCFLFCTYVACFRALTSKTSVRPSVCLSVCLQHQWTVITLYNKKWKLAHDKIGRRLGYMPAITNLYRTIP